MEEKEEKKEIKTKKKEKLSMNFPKVLAISFLLAGIFFVVFYFIQNDKYSDPVDDTKKEEISDLVPEDNDDYSIIKEDKMFYLNNDIEEITYNNKKVTIKTSFETKDEVSIPVTYVNDTKIENYYATSGFMLDNLFVVSSSSQYGENLIFFDKNLNKLEMEEDYIFNNIRVNNNGKIKATFLNNKMTFGTDSEYVVIDNVEINLCGNSNFSRSLSEYKEALEKHYDEIISGKAYFELSGNKIKVSYIKKDTVKSRLSQDIENGRGKYCAEGVSNG